MDDWQKLAIIISLLTFLRLVYHDIKAYIATRKKAKQKKRKRFSQKRKRK